MYCGDRQEYHFRVLLAGLVLLILLFGSQTFNSIRHLSCQLHLKNGVLTEIYKKLHFLLLAAFVNHVKDELTLGLFDLGNCVNTNCLL